MPFPSTSQPSRSLSHLELVLFDDATWLQVLPDLVEDSQHGNVGLSSASRRTDEKVLVSVVGCLKNDGLDPVQSLHAFEHQLSNLRSKASKKNINKCDLDYIYLFTERDIYIYTCMHTHTDKLGLPLNHESYVFFFSIMLLF